MPPSLLCALARAVALAQQKMGSFSQRVRRTLTDRGEGFFDAIATPSPTQSLGAFLTSTDAWASSSQASAGRTARKLIDGSGGRTELLGSFSYTTSGGKLAPMLVVEDSQAAFSFAEVCYSGDPFTVIVRETRGAETRDMTMADPRWAGHLTLLTAGTPATRPGAPLR